ncbi:RcnB family protein [Sphingorhabdus arenilitoris]|uniref:RcnB family protein n=1 Tax=Sphingorhabdus arenilitoris TaxID=1490041 RepID=A0ABV8RJW3_9SPHN
MRSLYILALAFATSLTPGAASAADMTAALGKTQAASIADIQQFQNREGRRGGEARRGGNRGGEARRGGQNVRGNDNGFRRSVMGDRAAQQVIRSERQSRVQNRTVQRDRNRDTYRDGRRWGDRSYSRNDRDYNRNDRRYDRNDSRYRDRGYNRGYSRGYDRGYNRGSNRSWNHSWRNDRRYDWYGHRNQYRSHYQIGRYYAPYRGHRYSRFNIGFQIGTPYYSSRYWLSDPYSYRLPPAYGNYRWVRYYDDVLLIDVRNGYVADVIHDFFW